MMIQGFRNPGPGLRLHLNENTSGCSPRVLEAIRALTAGDIAAYPDCRPAVLACAGHLGVDPDWVLLTNGLDEGLLMLAVARLGRDKTRAPEAIVPVPAFDPYFAASDAVGATVIRVPPRERFGFPLTGVLDALSPRTRLVYLNTPNNPTGQEIGAPDLRTVIEAAPQALVLVDEAYVEFGGPSFLTELPDHRNAVVGRTFSKAYGLAGMRIGCLVAHPDTLEPIRAVTPVLNLNIVAIAAVQAALRDSDFLPRYAAEVRESKRRLYEACARLRLEYWPSAANFVLVRVGEQARAAVDALSARGVHVRDRSTDAHTAGCVRITAGVVAHTEAAIAALEAIFE
ncbi:MAG: pyridoxal phosphate-dependent aminotransferase [Vicinamibacterales bacterium]